MEHFLYSTDVSRRDDAGFFDKKEGLGLKPEPSNLIAKYLWGMKTKSLQFLDFLGGET